MRAPKLMKTPDRIRKHLELGALEAVDALIERLRVACDKDVIHAAEIILDRAGYSPKQSIELAGTVTHLAKLPDPELIAAYRHELQLAETALLDRGLTAPVSSLVPPGRVQTVSQDLPRLLGPKDAAQTKERQNGKR